MIYIFINSDKYEYVLKEVKELLSRRLDYEILNVKRNNGEPVTILKVKGTEKEFDTLDSLENTDVELIVFSK